MSAVESTAIFALGDNASIQSVGEGAVVLLADSGQLFTCNETTEAFLTKLDGSRSFSDVVALLGDEYEAEQSVLAADFGALARQLLDERIIRRVN